MLLQRADGSVIRAGEGAADYVVLQNGQRGLVRRLREDGTYQLTNLGRRFFNVKRRQGDVPWDAMHRTLQL